MAKGKSRVKVSGVGLSKQIRTSTKISGAISGFKTDIKLTGIDAADILTGIEEGISDANKIIAEKLGEALDQAMEAAVWAWNDGASRDIIDTAALKASRRITVESSRLSITYDLPYAGLVHYGGYILPYGNKNAQKVYVPARPWVEAVVVGGGPVPKFDFESIYIDAIEKAF